MDTTTIQFRFLTPVRQFRLKFDRATTILHHDLLVLGCCTAA